MADRPIETPDAQADLTGRFVFVNDRYCEIAGRSREELCIDGSVSPTCDRPDGPGMILPVLRFCQERITISR